MLGQAANEINEIHLLQCGRGMFESYPWVLHRLPGVFPFYSSCKPRTLCYIDEAPGIAPTAKDPMGFISTKNKSAISAGSGGGYLNPSKIQSGGSVRFALLQDQPLEFFECWGESSEGGVKPFRFSDDPSPEDIEEEMGPEFERRTNREGTAPEKVKFAIAVPVYNYEASSVQIMQLSQKSLQNELDDISQMEDYANMLEWDFVMGKEGNGLETRYSLRTAPRKKGSQATIEAAWTEARAAGFDIGRLLTGENPFKAD
nr:hypothetical protein [uncultured Mediterranean phage uvMED]